MLKGHLGFGNILRRRLRGSSARQPTPVQIPAPGVLHHAQRKALLREQRRDRQTFEGAVLAEDALQVLRERKRQFDIAVVEPQQLAPKILRARHRMRAEPENMRQHERFARRFAQRLMGVAGLRIKQRFERLAAQLPQHAVTQPGEQLGETQAQLARSTQIIPGQVTDIRVSQMQDQGRR